MCIYLIFREKVNSIKMKCAPLRDGEPDCITCCISPHDNEQSLSPCSWLEALAYLNFRFAISIFFGSTVELYISRIHSKNCLPFYGIYFSKVRYRIICENCNATKS